jgi:hypothetical protein
LIKQRESKVFFLKKEAKTFSFGLRVVAGGRGRWLSRDAGWRGI